MFLNFFFLPFFLLWKLPHSRLTSDLQTVSIEWNLLFFPHYYASSCKGKTQSQKKWHEQLKTGQYDFSVLVLSLLYLILNSAYLSNLLELRTKLQFLEKVQLSLFFQYFSLTLSIPTSVIGVTVPVFGQSAGFVLNLYPNIHNKFLALSICSLLRRLSSTYRDCALRSIAWVGSGAR